MGGAFEQAWEVVVKADDEEPDEDFHALNDPNPTIAFGAAMRNNPHVAEMMRQRQEAYSKPYSEGGVLHNCANCGKTTDTSYFDVWDDEYCSSRCAEGEIPYCSSKIDGEGNAAHKCNWYVVRPLQRDNAGGMMDGGHRVELKCDDCGNEMWGWVS